MFTVQHTQTALLLIYLFLYNILLQCKNHCDNEMIIKQCKLKIKLNKHFFTIFLNML